VDHNSEPLPETPTEWSREADLEQLALAFFQRHLRR